jgi:hypothetical protein
MFSIVLTDICRSFLCVSKVTEKIKTRSKPTPSENFNSHPLFDECGRGIWIKLYATFWGVLVVKNALKNIDDCI